jgi:hypothetical protein
MKCSKSHVFVAATLFGLAVNAVPAFAQGKVSACPDRGGSDRPSHCEIREFQVPLAGSSLTVDASPNGGIAIQGWDRNEIQVRAKVTANAETQQEADALAADVRVVAQGGRIHSEGRRVNHGGWSVSFEVSVPAKHALTLSTTNGGVSIKDVQGQIAFETTNGGVTLTNVNGDVRGHTQNGGVRVQLSGDAWIGQGLDVGTHNGGIQLAAPESYSAHLDVGTTNGGLRCDFPVTVQGDLGRELSADIGRGGAVVKLRTVNGGVSVVRKQ